jgi:hypothetical protein
VLFQVALGAPPRYAAGALHVKGFPFACPALCCSLVAANSARPSSRFLFFFSSLSLPFFLFSFVHRRATCLLEPVRVHCPAPLCGCCCMARRCHCFSFFRRATFLFSFSFLPPPPLHQQPNDQWQRMVWLGCGARIKPRLVLGLLLPLLLLSLAFLCFSSFEASVFLCLRVLMASALHRLCRELLVPFQSRCSTKSTQSHRFNNFGVKIGPAPFEQTQRQLARGRVKKLETWFRA